MLFQWLYILSTSWSCNLVQCHTIYNIERVKQQKQKDYKKKKRMNKSTRNEFEVDVAVVGEELELVKCVVS